MAFWQSCSIKNNISVISSKFTNKFVQKCLCYHTLWDQSIPLVTIISVVSLSLRTEQLCGLLKNFSDFDFQFAPEVGPTISLPNIIREGCQEDAYDMVNKNNTLYFFSRVIFVNHVTGIFLESFPDDIR